MAYEQNLKTISLVAAADLSAKQFYFMIVDTNGKVNVNTTAGGNVDGVLLNDPASAAAATIAYDGICKVVVGSGGVTAADPIASDGSGKAATATSGQYQVGRALATGAAGAIIPVLLVRSGKQ